MATWNSLVIGSDIELLGDPAGAYSANPACPGARFKLQPGYNLGVAQSITDVVAALALDGSRPLGRRSDNRKLSIPIHIEAPTFAILAGAREYLLQTCNQDTWPLTWTRAQDAEPAPLPLIIDCFRAATPDVGYGGVDEVNRNPVWPITINCDALPYGRSDTPQQVLFPSPLQGQIAPSAWMNVDPYTTVASTTQGAAWSRSGFPDNGSSFPYSARWNRDGGYPYPIYTRTLPGSVNISGYKALSQWMAFGTDNWCQWNSGWVTFSFTLWDGGGHSITFGGTRYCTATNNPGWPQSQNNTFPIPIVGTFDYTTVTAYSTSLWTSGSGSTAKFASNTTDAYLNCLGVDPPAKGSPAVGTTRANVYSIGTVGTARAPVSLQFQQPAAGGTQSATFTTGGQNWWTPPPGVTDPTGVTVNAAKAEVWGGGGPGSRRSTTGAGGGGAGGEYARRDLFLCGPGTPVSTFVGGGGITGASPTNGGDSHAGGWDESAGNVIGHGGLAAAANSATGAVGNTATSISPVHFAGGSGANGPGAGGGGGSGAGTAAVGGNASGQTGGVAPSGGGTGGTGAASGGNNTGGNGTQPGGGSGGGVSIGGTGPGGTAAAGKVVYTWSGQIPTFKTLICHRPGPGSPTTFMPVIAAGNGADVPNGGTEYLVATPQPDSGVAAKYQGTYTVILVNSSWNTPANARDLTVTFKQYDYPGGPSSTGYAGGGTPSRTVTPNTDITNGICVLGEITLPLRDIDDDNTTAYYSAFVTSSNTSDRFLDIILLDTGGSTVLLNNSTGYANYWIDEPDINKGIGHILGSAYDRSQARSVLDPINTFISGGPMTLEPGNNTLLAYCVEGAPSLYATYVPRYWLDRTA